MRTIVTYMAVLLITAAPALDGKTSVSFSSEQLSADLPAPSDTAQLQYADSTKQVLFDTKESEDAAPLPIALP